MTTKAEKETKQEVSINEGATKAPESTPQVKGKSPANPNAYVLSQAAYQLYTSGAHGIDDIADRLERLEKYLVKVNAEE